MSSVMSPNDAQMHSTHFANNIPAVACAAAAGCYFFSGCTAADFNSS